MNPSIAAGFTLDSASTCPSVASSAGTLASGANCTFAVDFAPTVAGTVSGSLVLTDNNLNAVAPDYATQSIALSGTGIQTQTTPTITWPTPAAITAGTALSTTQLDATASVPGSFLYSPAAGTVLGAGTQTLSVSFTPTDTTDYTTATDTVTLTVTAAITPVVPTLSFAPIAPQTFGNAPFAVTATSASSGGVTYAVTSGPATISGNMVTLTGTGTVMLSASQAASGNYTAATATTSFTVTADFSLSAASGSSSSGAAASATTTLGGAASFSLTLNPGSGATFPHAVNFSATGLPPGATATFSPATIAAGSTATTVTLTIQTSASQTARNENPFSGNPMDPVAMGFLLLPLVGLKSVRSRLRQMPRLSLLAVATLSLGAMLIGLSGCAGGNIPTAPPTQPATNYTVVVTATDATTGVQSSTNLTLTVQ
jgi:hypothetical protein